MRVLTLLLTLVACGCTTTATREYRASEEQRIQEAVLLEDLKLRDTNRAVFVAFRHPDGSYTDPSDAVVSRVRTAGIPAQKASDATTGEHTIVVERATGKPGIIYYAGVVKWYGNSRVEVISGSRCASLGGGFSEFFMKKVKGKWIKTRIRRMVTI